MIVIKNLDFGVFPLFSCDIEAKPLILNRENKLVQVRKRDAGSFTIYLKKITRNRLAAIVNAIDDMEVCQVKHSMICVKRDKIGFGSRYFEEDNWK